MLLDSKIENIHYGFSPDIPPVVEIQSGESITVETLDASNGQMRPGRQSPIDRSILLPVTGPIAVAGARPEDSIAIRIDRIDFAPLGYAWLRSGLGFATPADQPDHLLEFTIEGDRVTCDRFSVALRPMVGIIGVAPKNPVPTRQAGRHGGNLDCTALAPGNILWLPVETPGGLVSLGDAHAAMGDGEVSGSGVEIDATVQLTVTLHPEVTIDGPVVVCPDETLYLASAPTLEQALADALNRAIAGLMQHRKLSRQDAYVLASISGDAKICQVVNGDCTVAFAIPAEVLRW